MAKECICAADLEHRIEIQEPTESVDSAGYGDATPAWNTVMKAWAKIDTTGSREFYRASQTHGTITHLITIWHRKGITIKHRVKFGNRVMGIAGIVNPGERSETLQLACIESMESYET